MASTYAKNTAFHQTVGFISLFLIVLGYWLLDQKQCQAPMLSRDELPDWLGFSTDGSGITGPGLHGGSSSGASNGIGGKREGGESGGIGSGNGLIRKWSRFKTITELSSKLFRDRNDTVSAERLDYLVLHYYDLVQVCHLVLAVWCSIIIMLGFVNLIPLNEDAKVFTILTLICIMGLMALFALFTAFIAFHKPCREAPTNSLTPPVDSHSPYFNFNTHQTRSPSAVSPSVASTIPASPVTTFYQSRVPSTTTISTSSGSGSSATSTVSSISRRQRPHQNSSTSISVTNSTNVSDNSGANLWKKPTNFKLEFRAIKDKRPVNVYEDDDDVLIRTTLMDASVGFALLCSTFLYFFDSRQHMIEWRN